MLKIFPFRFDITKKTTSLHPIYNYACIRSLRSCEKMKESVYIAQNVYQNNFLSCQVLFHNVYNARNSQQTHTHTHKFEVLFVYKAKPNSSEAYAYSRAVGVALLVNEN